MSLYILIPVAILLMVSMGICIKLKYHIEGLLKTLRG